MANKLKKSSGKKVKADPKKADSKAFKQEKEEKIDWKKLARDERTWKITGALFLLIAIFLVHCLSFRIFLPGKKTRIRFSGGYPLYG